MATSSFNKHFVVKDSKTAAVLCKSLANPCKVSVRNIRIDSSSKKGAKLLKQSLSN